MPFSYFLFFSLEGWSARHNDEMEVVRVERWNETDKMKERQEKKERKGIKQTSGGGGGGGEGGGAEE